MDKAEQQLPQGKQTALGLYVTAEEAYEQWQANPDKVMILDVRTPEEYLYVGHPTMAWKIPVASQSYEWDADQQQFPLALIPDFVARVMSVAKPDDRIMAMCRSGGRSAIAINLLARGGFTRVYNITDGMEGDTEQNPDSPNYGRRTVNGWKNADLPWTCDLTPDKLVLPNAD